MTDKEQIMIDGVDILDCDNYYVEQETDQVKCDLSDEYCRENKNCFYKQLARKEQECEELKRKLSNQEQLYQNEIEIYNESCLQLRQENDDLYLERLALNTANSGINSLLEIKEQENDRYGRALNEIEEYAKNYSEVDLFEDIIDIINKAKGE